MKSILDAYRSFKLVSIGYVRGRVHTIPANAGTSLLRDKVLCKFEVDTFKDYWNDWTKSIFYDRKFPETVKWLMNFQIMIQKTHREMSCDISLVRILPYHIMILPMSSCESICCIFLPCHFKESLYAFFSRGFPALNLFSHELGWYTWSQTVTYFSFIDKVCFETFCSNRILILFSATLSSAWH